MFCAVLKARLADSSHMLPHSPFRYFKRQSILSKAPSSLPNYFATKMSQSHVLGASFSSNASG